MMAGPGHDSAGLDEADLDVLQRQAGRYLRGAIDLRNAVHFNEIDARFADDDHGEIRYVFDANVVRFFLNPFKASEYQKVSPFGELARNTLQALAAITAEFLMSRQLAGQWGGTPLISSGHAEEVARYAADLRQIGLDQLKLLDQDQISPEIRTLINSARRETGLRKTIHSDFQPLRGLEDHLDDPALEARELARVVQQNLLRPIHLDDFALPDMLKVDAADLADMVGFIQQFRNAVPGSPELSQKGDENDALAVLQVAQLNDAVSAEANLTRPIRYVFVTTDQSVYNATVAWWWENRGQDYGGDAFPVRRLTQYVPFLNVAEMPNKANTTSVFRDVRSAVEAFIVADGRRLGAPPRQLPAWQSQATNVTSSPFFDTLREFASEMTARTESDAVYRNTLKELNALWRNLTRETVFLNANLLGRKIEAFRKLSAFLAEAEDVREAGGDLIRATVAEVERAHAKLSVQDSLAEMVNGQDLAEGSRPARRALAVPASRFRDLIDVPLFDYLTDFVQNAEPAKLDKLLKHLGECAAHRAFIFVAAVAFWASRWESASHFLERAKELLPMQEDPLHPQERPDLLYLDCVINRYVVMDADIDRSTRVARLQELTINVEELNYEAKESGDSFLQCRAALEATLLNIQIAFAMHSVKRAETAVPEADQFFNRAIEHSQSIWHHHRTVSEQLEGDTRRVLDVEVIIAVTYCLVYRLLYHSAPVQPVDAGLDTHVKAVKKLMERVGDIIPEIYRPLPDLLDIVAEPSLDKTRSKVNKIIHHLKTFRENQITTTRLDDEGMPILIRKLSRHAKTRSLA